MGFLRIAARLRGDGMMSLSEATSAKIRLVGFLSGGDATLYIEGDRIRLTRDTESVAYDGTILDWCEAASLHNLPFAVKR